mgnify:CR=1 FL=1
MKKYIGQFRTICPFDKITGKPIKEDISVACYGKSLLYRISKDRLVYLRPSKVQKALTDKFMERGVTDFVVIMDNVETMVEFTEKDLDKVLDVIKPVKSGASTKPWSVKNKRYNTYFG